MLPALGAHWPPSLSPETQGPADYQWVTWLWKSWRYCGPRQGRGLWPPRLGHPPPRCVRGPENRGPGWAGREQAWWEKAQESPAPRPTLEEPGGLSWPPAACPSPWREGCVWQPRPQRLCPSARQRLSDLPGPRVQPRPGPPSSRRQAHQRGLLANPRNEGVGMGSGGRRANEARARSSCGPQRSRVQGSELQPPSWWTALAPDCGGSSAKLRAKVREQRVGQFCPSQTKPHSFSPPWAHQLLGQRAPAALQWPGWERVALSISHLGKPPVLPPARLGGGRWAATGTESQKTEGP